MSSAVVLPFWPVPSMNKSTCSVEMPVRQYPKNRCRKLMTDLFSFMAYSRKASQVGHSAAGSHTTGLILVM